MSEVRDGAGDTAEDAARDPGEERATDPGEDTAADAAEDTVEAAEADAALRRPEDADPAAETVPAGIGLIGWLRWSWRQLTSMRTALVLLFLLAVASVPGSLLPQEGLNPEKVDAYARDNPELARWLDRFSLFDVFASPWYVAIYLLLFISLAGCVLPRSWRHVRAVRSRPPAAPRNLSRLPQAAGFETGAAPDRVVEVAGTLLRGRRFRADTDAAGRTVAAEKGYLGETGNLVFHLALLVLLFAVAGGAAYGYRGNVLVTEGDGFANTLASYDSFRPGSAFAAERLAPFSFTVEDFRATYVEEGTRRGQPDEFTARLRYKDRPGAPGRPYELRVNHPLTVDGTKVYLLGHGYAPTFTVKDGKGEVAFEGAVPFLPADERTYASEGVIKVPDARPEQLGFVGMFWPTAAQDARGQVVSAFPAAANPAVALFPFKGDLGLDSGTPQSVYRLDVARMRRVAADRRPLRPGETMTLPDKAGSITFTGYREWVSLQVNHDPGRAPALAAGLAAIGGVVATFLVRRRRVWVRATPGGERGPGRETGTPPRTVVEVGGLTLGAESAEFDEIVERLRSALETVSPSEG